MKKFSESGIGIFLLTFLPAFGWYITMLNDGMRFIINHIGTYWQIYSAILIWVLLLIIAYVRHILLEGRRKYTLLVRYIELLHEEVQARQKNNEFVESNWRSSLIHTLNTHFKNAEYREGVTGISNISVEIGDSEEITHYKTEKVKDLQSRINELRRELLS